MKRWDDDKWWVYRIYWGGWVASSPLGQGDTARDRAFDSWREAMDYVIQEARL